MRSRCFLHTALLGLALVQPSLGHAGASVSALTATTQGRGLARIGEQHDGLFWRELSRRGGAKLATKPKEEEEPEVPKREGAVAKIKEAYVKVPLATRVHLTLILIVTVLSLGLIDPVFLVLDLNRTFRNFELWRPFTAAAFLGAPSMSWLSSTYFMVQYGQSLEMSEGTAQQVVFLLFQVATLSLLAGVIGLPVTSNSLITAALHCCGRLDPKRDVNWMFALRVKYWVLPYCLAAVDVLQSQNPMAALPHALGVLTGHLYYFLRHIWPKLGGSELLKAPERLWLLNRSKNDEAVFGKAKPVSKTTGSSKSSSSKSSSSSSSSSSSKKKSTAAATAAARKKKSQSLKA